MERKREGGIKMGKILCNTERGCDRVCSTSLQMPAGGGGVFRAGW